MTEGALLSVQDLKVHFPIKGGMLGTTFAHVRAVDGVSFELKSGETLGIVGESGCGKSTLGRAVLRLIKATDGRVVWAGQDLFGLGAKALRDERRQMQIIFQDPLASLDPRMSVETIIGKPLRIFHPELSRAEVRKRVFETMNQVGLAASMANRYPHEFSGGQCQRIGIARAIILKPKLIVCDEPVSALDVSIQAQIINLFKSIQRRLGISYLFIAHDLAVVRHVSDTIGVMYLGRLVEVTGARNLYANPLHPYTRALLSAIPITDYYEERKRTRVVLKGEVPSPIDTPSGCTFHPRCPLATEKCRTTIPQLRSVESGHQVACHNV